MYWDFPSVTAADRLERSPALDRVRRSGCRRRRRYAARRTDAAAGAGAPQHVRRPSGLSLPRRPRRDASSTPTPANEQREVSNEMMDARRRGLDRSAGQRRERRAGRAKSISGRCRRSFATLRPLWKYSWPDGEQVYVSRRHRRGRAVHDDRLAARRLRRRHPALALLHAAAQARARLEPRRHLVVGHRHGRRDPRHRHRRLDVFAVEALSLRGAPTSIPYRGQKRWHTVFGLIFGLGAATWAFSGMLSMDPFPARTGGRPAPRQPAFRRRFAGGVQLRGVRGQASARGAGAARRRQPSRNWS